MNILITGASRGLGFIFAKHLASKGHRVFAACRSPQTSDDLRALEKKEPNVEIVELDVTNTMSIHLLIKHFQSRDMSIDILVNNAGYGVFGPVESVKIDEARAMFDVNLFGLMELTNQVIPMMRKQRSGLIVNISSISGLTPSKNAPVYAATKFALEAITAGYAEDLKQWNIRVCSINPGYTATDFAKSALVGSTFARGDSPYSNDPDLAEVQENVATGQDPEDIAHLLEKLIHEKNPKLWNLCSERGAEFVESFYKDPTGNSMLT